MLTLKLKNVKILESEPQSSSISPELTPAASSEIIILREKRMLAAQQMRNILPLPDSNGRWTKFRDTWVPFIIRSPFVISANPETPNTGIKSWLERSTVLVNETANAQGPQKDLVWLCQLAVNARGRSLRGAHTDIVMRTWGDDVSNNWGAGPAKFETDWSHEYQLAHVESTLNTLELIATAGESQENALSPSYQRINNPDEGSLVLSRQTI